MSTLTRISINPARRNGRKLLTNPQAMHAAVRASFPPDIAEDNGRVLWRVDPQDHESVLYIVGPEKPTGALIVEQAGWDSRPAQSADYDRFLNSLMKGQRWHFEIVGNPTYSAPNGKRGKVKAHVSVRHQLDWLYKQADRAGFALAPRIDDDCTDEERARWSAGDAPMVMERWTDVFGKGKESRGSRNQVRTAKARFSGTLEVTDAAALRGALINGIGRARAYGCGLLTLAPVQ